MKNPIIFALGLGLITLTLQPVGAVDSPVGSPDDYRIKHIAYNEQDVVRLDAIIGLATHIITGPDEEYVTHAFGDPEGWEFAHQKNHYFLKPKAQNSDTNLILVTTRHSYNFVLHFIGEYAGRDRAGNRITREIKTPWSMKEAILQVSFTYPREAAKAAAEQQSKTRIDQLFDSRRGDTNLNYSLSATPRDQAIAPVNVWDDGRFTYFKFSPNTDLPNIYTVSADGSEVIVNRHMLPESGSQVIVAEKLAAKFTLRLGRNVVGIYNESFDSVGQQNNSGTASPAVRRILKAPSP